MSKTALATFTEYTSKLLPHETGFLLQIQKFIDPERLEILKKIHAHVQSMDSVHYYNTDIDKRKYNHLKNWMMDQLNKVDVDSRLKKIHELSYKIRIDSIVYEEEKLILSQLKRTEPSYFFFNEFYELVLSYRQFLLIRLRYRDHDLADDFIKRFKDEYQSTKEQFVQLHDATYDIVRAYSGGKTDTLKWENWLRDVILDEKKQGFLRYQSFVNLNFISHNHKKPDLVSELFHVMEYNFLNGNFYSKRVLLNYYNMKLMFHAGLKEYDTAMRYGYLSIRDNTHDSLLYTNNLCAVLMRLNRNEEALHLMQAQSYLIKKSKNYYNRVGYVAFHIEAMIKTGNYKQAESYGEKFLNAYRDEVLQFRWHLFFSVYLEAIVHTGNFEKIIKSNSKYKLLALDQEYKKNANYFPVVTFFIQVALFQTGRIKSQEFTLWLERSLEDLANESGRQLRFKTTIKNWIRYLPKAAAQLYK
jgi:hypothetical protein